MILVGVRFSLSNQEAFRALCRSVARLGASVRKELSGWLVLKRRYHNIYICIYLTNLHLNLHLNPENCVLALI